MKKTLPIFITICGLAKMSFAQVPSYVPANGLVGYWPFTGNAYDESGNGNNGTVNGATLTSDRFGNVNKAYSFDGVDDYIDLGDLFTVLDNLSQFSLSYWFNSSLAFNTFGSFNNGGVFSHWIYNGQPTTSIGFQTSINTQGVIETSTVGGTGAASSSSVQQNFDTHICITFNGNNSVSEKFKLFINGSFIENLNLGINGQLGNAGNKTIIGGYIGPGYPNYVYFNFLGILDDIGIWNRALTQQEITDLYNASTLTLGCINPLACNYDPSANNDDGSCNYPTTTTDTITICEGGSVTVGTSIYNTAGSYIDTLQTTNGCDSIVNTTVEVMDLTIAQNDTTICFGDSIVLSVGTSTSNACALPTNLQNGLVGYWPFCGNANDESGNGNNGTVNGATLTNDMFGNANSAYSFDGTSSYINIPYDFMNGQTSSSTSFKI